MSNSLLKAENISISFNGNQILKNVHLDINVGEVHALMGENGAGKSTLIKIITGLYKKNSGKIYWKNKEVEINSINDCKNLGISCIYQELSVIPALTVAQNILIGREPKKMGIIDYKKLNKIVDELIKKYDFPLKSTDLVENLSVGKRQLVEILKGLSVNSELLIMDEPTASLSGKESESLFKIIDNLRKNKVSIIYISHRLDEVYKLSDRLTILRNGLTVDVLEKKDIIPKKVVEMMIGKELKEDIGSYKKLVDNDNEVLLEINKISKKGEFKDISFNIKKGEILGISGLIGSGRTEVIRSIYGIDKIDSGEIYFENKKYNPSVQESILKGIGFLPEDRKNQGYIPLLSIEKNTSLINYDLIKDKYFLVDEKEEVRLSQDIINKLLIKPNDPYKQVGLMSGGNQQKVVLGKWLIRDLKLLIIDEPTAGVDVGAKEEIYKILDDLADKGVSILLVTSDLQELLRLSHRILIMRKGKMINEFKNVTVTQSDVLIASQGV